MVPDSFGGAGVSDGERLSVLTGRHAFNFQELPVEVGDIGKTDFKADIGDRIGTDFQPFASLADAQANHKLNEPIAGGFFEVAREKAG